MFVALCSISFYNKEQLTLLLSINLMFRAMVIRWFLLHTTVCESEGLLTNSEELLDSVIGSLSIPSDSPINQLVTTSNEEWCTTNDLGSDPYFQLNFTSMVSLTYMRARGFTGILPPRSTYVKRFKLESQDESGNFSAYGITSEPTVKIY